MKRPLTAGSLFLIAIAFLIDAPASFSQARVTYQFPSPKATLVRDSTPIGIRSTEKIDRSKISSTIFTVNGEQSGSHEGIVKLSADNRTLVFYPKHSFTYGEKVNISFKENIALENGSTLLASSFSFTIREKMSIPSAKSSSYTMTRPPPPQPGGGMPMPPPGGMPMPLGGMPMPPGGMGMPGMPDTSTHTEGSFPQIDLLVHDHPYDPAMGKIFMTNFKFGEKEKSDNFLLIVDQTAKVVQNKFMGYGTSIQTGALDFRVQPTGYLSYCSTNDSTFHILDSNMKEVARIKSSAGLLTDVHELLFRPDGSYFMFSLDEQVVDMSKVVTGGDSSAKIDQYVIEGFDKNGVKIFDWRTDEHFQIIDANDSVDLKKRSVDYCHPNTLEFDRDGNLLVSSRFLDEITKINIETGEIMWRWGGKKNEFTFVNDSLHFYHQHSIRSLANGNYLLLDNGNFHKPFPFSRACEYTLDPVKKTATLIWQYRHSPDIFSKAMGSVQRLPNGNTLIGWGSNFDVALTEVTPEGQTALEMRMYNGFTSYRIFKFPWTPPKPKQAR